LSALFRASPRAVCTSGVARTDGAVYLDYKMRHNSRRGCYLPESNSGAGPAGFSAVTVVELNLKAAKEPGKIHGLSENSESETDQVNPMYCNKCGQPVPEQSQFCNHCGAQVAVSAITPIADQALADEHELFSIRPTMIFVWIRYIIAALLVITVAAIMGVLSNKNPNAITGTIAFLVIGLVALVAFAFPVYRHILRLREVYTLTNHKLEMRFGLIAKIVRNIPLSKIQDVTVTSSVWQRFMNLGDIEIDSASEAGKIVLDDIHFPDRYANMVMAELRRRN